MADISGITTNFFPIASETYQNNLSASIAALDTTVFVNANNTYADGDTVVLTVDAGTANSATFRGTKASTPARFINCKWTEGNLGVGHVLGATIADYDTATHISIMTKGIKQFANDDGSLKAGPIQTALGISNLSNTGFNALGYAPNTVVYNGNRSYTCTFNSIDLTGALSPGMRVRTTRTVAAPTQATSLNGTNQYWSKAAPAGMTFTDNFTVSGWIKPTSYGAGTIISRYNGSTGFILQLNGSGQVIIYGAGAANRQGTTYQSLPLNKWSHIAATMTMSTGTVNMYIDGVLVPSAVTGAGTSLTQAGNLEVGSFNATTFFPGKIAQAAVFSAVLSAATIQSYISQGLAGTETSLVSAYSFNGNANDLNTTNANNLTSNNAAAATAADSPFGGQAGGAISSTLDYGIVQTSTFSTNTTAVIQVAEGCTIPTSVGGVSGMVYSSSKVPYGFPGQRGKWTVDFLSNIGSPAVSPANNVWTNAAGHQLTVPVGEWRISYQAIATGQGSGGASVFTALSTSNSSLSDIGLETHSFASITGFINAFVTREKYISVSSAIAYYLNLMQDGSTTNMNFNGTQGTTLISAENAYL